MTNRIQFIIPGAQRSGTTFLYKLLDDHPDIFMAKPLKPEPKYFLKDIKELDMNYYLNKYFEEKMVKGKVIGEKSTSYFIRSDIPHKLYNFNPNMKLIFLLRNPIDRAVSNYYFSKNNGLETRDIREALMNEELYADNLNISENPFAYKYKGNYIYFLNNFLRFFNKEKCLLIKSEDLFANTESELKRVYNFLGVNTDFTPSVPMDYKINESVKDINRIPEEIVEYLSSYFEKSNTELMKHFNINFL
ncbi:sulfotransferase family protein [Gracilibacillus xinjiangensis]|uniref:Sulfotransferase family protein n=1 Tax=Gracilibacillus xinjiangensis TaxID=1193282 RepID=A0ABV8WUK6_9BACI